MKNKKLFWLAAIAGMVFILSCKTTGAANETITLNGMVYDFTNKPVPYCEISIGEKFGSGTDINGRFTVTGIPPGVYPVTGQKEGYETYMEELPIQGIGQIIYIRIPSLKQLIDLTELAMKAQNMRLVEEYAERALAIDGASSDAFMYCATVKLSKNDIPGAINVFETGIEAGNRDIFIELALEQLRETWDALRKE